MTFSMRFCTPWKPARMRAVLAALPFPHRRHEDRRHAAYCCARPERQIEVLERLARPEHALEPVGGAHQPADDHDLLDDDCPADDRCRDQPDHDEFDERRCLPEQVPERCVAGIERNLSRLDFHSSPFRRLPRMRRISKATVSKLRLPPPAIVNSTTETSRPWLMDRYHGTTVAGGPAGLIHQPA